MERGLGKSTLLCCLYQEFAQTLAVTLCHACSSNAVRLQSPCCASRCRFIGTNDGGSPVISEGLFKQLPEALQAELSPMNVVSGKREAPRACLLLTGHRELTLRQALLRFPVCVGVAACWCDCVLVWVHAGVAACWCGCVFVWLLSLSWSCILYRNLDVDGCRRRPVHHTCGSSTCYGKWGWVSCPCLPSRSRWCTAT